MSDKKVVIVGCGGRENAITSAVAKRIAAGEMPVVVDADRATEMLNHHIESIMASTKYFYDLGDIKSVTSCNETMGLYTFLLSAVASTRVVSKPRFTDEERDALNLISRHAECGKHELCSTCSSHDPVTEKCAVFEAILTVRNMTEVPG